MEIKTLILDNYDSFTYNLYQYCAELGGNPVVYYNDAITVKAIERLRPTHIIISPGPGTPLKKKDFGICGGVIKQYAATLPILGVCLGHQGIIASYGGRVIPAPEIMHGKTSLIHHDGKNLFSGIENPFVATRYHSLIIEKMSLPRDLETTAWTKEGEIMGVRHKKWKVEGVQFHPESILTEPGKKILENFLNL